MVHNNEATENELTGNTGNSLSSKDDHVKSILTKINEPAIDASKLRKAQMLKRGSTKAINHVFE